MNDHLFQELQKQNKQTLNVKNVHNLTEYAINIYLAETEFRFKFSYYMDRNRISYKLTTRNQTMNLNEDGM